MKAVFPSPHSPVALLGVPLDLGAENLGVDMGPAAFRHQGIAAKLAGAGLSVSDAGTIGCADRQDLVPGDPRQHYLDEIIRVNEAAAKAVEGLIGSGQRVLGLGGDHSVNLGLFAGAAAAVAGDLGLIYLDAHGDMNTAETTLTGNVHGMHLAALMGFGTKALVNVHTPGAKLKPANLLHIGGSDFDSAETALAAREHLPMFSMFDLMCQNLAPLLAMIDDLASRVDHIWVSLDLDAIDSSYAPGAGMPSLGGLSYREIAAIMSYIGRHCPVVGLDIVEYNPLQDEHNKTAELGIELAAKAFGTDYSWYANYLQHNRVA